MMYVVWGILLVVQNAAFTMVSRARNSGSYSYHAIASLFSNGVWFISQFILIDQIVKIIRSGSWVDAMLIGVMYSICTLVGSVGMHWITITYIEKGKRKVGA